MKLAEVIDSFVSGDWGNEEYSNESPNAVFCVRGADIVPISNHSFNNIPKRYVSNRTIETKLLKEGDLVVEKSGGSPTQSTGRVVYISKDLIENAGSVVCSNFCTAIRVKPEWSPLYVYYYWQNIYNRGIFFNFEGKTSGIKNLQMDNALSAIEIEYLPLDKQDEIVATLSAIDSKIAINRQINDNLEAMAKQLYDYWFVQFDFPNEEGKPYKSSGGKMVWNEKLKREIPEGWYADNICRIADILSGGTPSKQVDSYWQNGNIPFFGPTDYTGAIFQLTTAEHITNEGLKHCASSIFEEGIVIITARGSIGKIVVVGTPMAMNQSCYAFRPRNDEFEYLFFLTAQLIEHLKAKGSGSVFKSIITADIENSILSIADKTTITLFTSTIRPLMNAIKENTKQIELLIKQRDELLPLLMNGQVSVNYHLSHD